MKITNVRTTRVELPFETPIRTAIHEIRSVGCVLVYVETDEGLTGESYMFTLSAKRLDVLEAMLHSLDHHLRGRDPHDVRAIWEAMWRDINFFGHKGVTIFALSALDAACWDLVGKAAGLPLRRLLGAARDRVPAYASAGLWVSMEIDDLTAQAKSFVADGFRAMKMRLGRPSVAEDAERVAAVREAIGPDIALMADANQGFTVSHAIRLGRAIERYGLVWFEEPVQAYDLEGSGKVAAALDTPIASGETEYARYGFRDMLKSGAADIWMPDLQRVGGITEFMRVAELAAAHDIPVSPHIFTEQSLQLCGAIPNCPYAEHMPWFTALFAEPMELKDGELLIPDRPGLGFSFDPDAVERFRIRD